MGHLILGKFAREHLHDSTLPPSDSVRVSLRGSYGWRGFFEHTLIFS
jgi:hypothetical protein